MSKPSLAYRRIILKISGEGFCKEGGHGIDHGEIQSLAERAESLAGIGVELAIVVGGGNIVRGAQLSVAGVNRATADQMGMIATVINAISLQDRLERDGVVTRTQSAIVIQQVAEPFIRRRALRHLEKGRVVIFAGGTGNPFMTTDTTAALRAIEMDADVLLMAKNKVDGIYDSDPLKNPKAKRFDKLTHLQALNLRLGVMDATALSLCLENKLPIVVFDLEAERGLERAVMGEPIGTLVVSEG